MRGSSIRRTTICWFATPSRTRFGQAGLATKRFSAVGEAVAVHDLAVADEAGGQLEARAAHHAAGVDLGGCEVAAVDVETDDAAL